MPRGSGRLPLHQLLQHPHHFISHFFLLVLTLEVNEVAGIVCHSVRDLVQRAIEDDRIDVVDLGPSGSDAFTELKTKYGFESVVDWPAVADYSGDFIYLEGQNENEEMGDEMLRMLEQLMQRHAARASRQEKKDSP